MPRYYFHLFGEGETDPEGQKMPSLSLAVSAAASDLQRFAELDLERGIRPTILRIDIADETGRVVESVHHG